MIWTIFFLVGCDTFEKRRETVARIKCKANKGTCKLHHLTLSKSSNSILVCDFICCCDKCKQKAYNDCLSMHADFSDVPGRIKYRVHQFPAANEDEEEEEKDLDEEFLLSSAVNSCPRCNSGNPCR